MHCFATAIVKDMALSTRQKFFFILAGTALFSLLVISVAMHWRFNTAFDRYRVEQAEARLEDMAPAFIQFYVYNGSFDSLRFRSRAPNERFMHPSARENFWQNRVLDPEERAERSSRLPPWLRLRGLQLHNAEGAVVFGLDGQALAQKSLVYQDEHIGELVLNLPPLIDRLGEQRFFSSLRFAWLVAFIIVSAFILLLSAYLARTTILPIEAIIAHVRQLSGGDFMERNKVKRKDELGELAQYVNELALTLESNEQLRKLWTATTAHELRTPVTILQGELEAMLGGVRPINAQQLESVREEVIHLAKLIEDLNTLSLADAGSLSYQKQPLDFSLWLTEALSPMKKRLDSKQLTLEMKIEDGCVINADQTRLQQLIDNLLNNSLKYTDQGGQVSIQLSKQNPYALLVIEDSAPAPPSEDISSLFEPFFRAESSRNRALGGSGLGLAISQKIVEAHGGRIEAFASSLGGLGLRIALPLHLGGR